MMSDLAEPLLACVLRTTLSSGGFSCLQPAVCIMATSLVHLGLLNRPAHQLLRPQRAKTAASSGSLTYRRRYHVVTKVSPDDPDEVNEALKQDLARYQRRAATTSDGVSNRITGNNRFQQGSPVPPEPATLKDTLDKILIADFFLVLAILGWLAAGVLQSLAFHNSGLLDAWYPLWPLVWQPAIGVLMLGALVSGGAGWLQEQRSKRS